MSEPQNQTDLVEPDCQLATEQGLAEGSTTRYTRLLWDPPDDVEDESNPVDVGEWSAILTVPDAEIDAFIGSHAATFLDAAGEHEGVEAPVRRAALIARRNGLQVLSTRRLTVTADSDHDAQRLDALAIDASNFPSPTPEMDRAAGQIAAAMGLHGWGGGELVIRNLAGIRARLLWRLTGHTNHVHFGCRRIDP